MRKKIYTNLMIALFAKSSTNAKSTTAQVALDVLYEAGLGYHLTPKRISPQKLTSDMAGAHIPVNYHEMTPDQQERTRRRLAMAGQRGMFLDEFGKFVKSVLRKQSTNADFVSLLLEFDACPKDFDTSTFSRGGENIEAPYLSLLGCMTPPDLRENSRSGADFWTDGFWARFSFVAAPPDADKDETLELGLLPIPEELIDQLTAWDERLGVPECYLDAIPGKDGEPSGKYTINRASLRETRAEMTDDAHAAFVRYRSALKALFKPLKHQDFNGSYIRLPETALRIAILMASLENNNLVEIRHWARAQELAELLRLSLHEMYSQVNASDMIESQGAKVEDEIIKHLTRHGALTVNTLRTSYMKQYSSKQLEEVLNAMIRGGTITKFKTSHSYKYALIQTNHVEGETDVIDPFDTTDINDV
jgi:Protein of unknown function (DUF3987)